MNRRTMLGAAGIVAGIVLLLPGLAQAGSRYVVPQAPCDKVGAAGVARNGETYRCEQRPGDDCPRWRWVYRAPAATAPPANAGPQLPVTGAPIGWLTGGGIGLVAGGAGLVLVGRRRRLA